jgi:hypothetical protein
LSGPIPRYVADPIHAQLNAAAAALLAEAKAMITVVTGNTDPPAVATAGSPLQAIFGSLTLAAGNGTLDEDLWLGALARTTGVMLSHLPPPVRVHALALLVSEALTYAETCAERAADEIGRTAGNA